MAGERDGVSVPPRTLAECSYGELPWVACVARRLLLARLERLCISEELDCALRHNCGAICEEAKATNVHLAARRCALRVDCSDLIDTMVRVRSDKLAQLLLCKPLPERILAAAQLEAACLREVLNNMAICVHASGESRGDADGGGAAEMEVRVLNKLWRQVAVKLRPAVTSMPATKARELSVALTRAAGHQGAAVNASL